MRKLRLFAGVMAFAVLMLASTSCGSERGILFIQVIPSNAVLSTCQASTVQFIANGVFERGPDENITSRVTWASAQPQIVTISNDSSSKGLASSGVQSGNTVITASLDGVTDTASVTNTVCP